MKLRIFAFGFTVAIFSALTAFSAEKHKVTGSIVGAYMTPYYQVSSVDVVTDKNQIYLRVRTQGDCSWQYRFRCDGSSYPPHRSCYYERQLYCHEELGYFALPQDEVTVTEKRIKFIKDDHYMTLANLKGFSIFKYWRLKNFVKIDVSDDLTEASFLIFEPKK